jgi:hypothetical protein
MAKQTRRTGPPNEAGMVQWRWWPLIAPVATAESLGGEAGAAVAEMEDVSRHNEKLATKIPATSKNAGDTARDALRPEIGAELEKARAAKNKVAAAAAAAKKFKDARPDIVKAEQSFDEAEDLLDLYDASKVDANNFVAKNKNLKDAATKIKDDVDHLKDALSKIVAVLIAVVALAVVVRADIVLHPGTVSGTAGLTNWTFDSGSISVGGNPNGFSGSTSIAGTAGAYALTVEGGQTYGSVSESFTQNNPYTSFSMSRTTTLTVPVGGAAANEDLLTPGGSVRVNVTATTAPGASAAISNVYTYAYASNAAGTESYSSLAYSYNTSAALLPMAATQAAVNVYGSAYFALTDQNGQSCFVSRSIPYPYPTVPSLGEGEVATIDQAFDLTGELCAAAGVGTISGTVQFNSPPPAFAPNAGYVCASGPTSQCAAITSNPFTYAFPNLPVGYYSVYASEQFGTANTTSLNVSGNGGVNYAYLQPGDSATVNFVYDAAVVQGTFTVNGPLASRLSSGASYSSAYFFFRPDNSVSNPPNAGNYAYSYLPSPLVNPSTPYTAGLTAGPWKASDFYANAYGNNDAVYVSVYDQSAPVLNATAGATLTADAAIDTTEGDIVFDVSEPAGQPTIGISNPYVYVSQWDATSQKYVYLTSQSYAQNAATPVVRLIGPPGRYQFQAYAQILGSYISFATSTIDLGLGANTPAGTNEQVTLLDASGNPTGVQLTFANVTAGGTTTGSTTTVGPAPPGGFTIMPAFNGNTYLSINTTATFTGNVGVALTYDPAALGLSAAQERFLQLWHFHCDASGSNCAWQYINDASKVPNPNTAMHVIYGVTDSFSDFALLLPSSQHPPVVACVGGAAQPMVLGASASACAAVADNATGLAGTCRDGGSGLASCLFDGASSLNLGLGPRAVVVNGTAGDGSSAQCTSYITVKDVTAPALTVSASPSVLWPPNGKLWPIRMTATAADSCDPRPVVSCTATSSEAGRPGGRADEADIVWVNGQLSLRAERRDKAGRVYTIACTAIDAGGNAVTATTTVSVPHDQR